ncbi:MAG: hypothetical protein QM739_00920 [Propionivibrio sp.]
MKQLTHWLAVLSSTALLLNSAFYFADLFRYGIVHAWQFHNLQGWGFRFIFHALVAAIALTVFVIAWLFSHARKVPIRRGVLLAALIGLAGYAMALASEIVLPALA